MNNYIIDPAVFYWINVLGILQTLTAVLGSVLLTLAIGFMVAYFYKKDEASSTEWDSALRKRVPCIDEEDMKMANAFKKISIIMSIIGVVFVIISVFTPGKVTGIEMLIAKTATVENMNMTVEGMKEVVDYIVQAIKSVV